MLALPFNRTIVELKPRTHPPPCSRILSDIPFNRTIVELKPVCSGFGCRAFVNHTFNRTIVELKRLSKIPRNAGGGFSLLIEPLWN